MNELTLGTGVLAGLVLLSGGGLTAVALRASRRTGARALRLLAAGFGAITLGSVFSTLIWLFASDTAVALLAGNALVAIGLACLVYALYTSDERLETTRSRPS